MKKAKEELKTRKVSFEISEKLTMPELLAKGYKRTEVEALFKELHEKKLGYYIEGKRGLAPSTCFVSVNCPREYSIDIEYFRIRKTKKELEKSVVENNFSDPIVEKFKTTELKYGSFPETDKPGYVIGFQEDQAFLVRLAAGGFNSIEEAVKQEFDRFEKVVCFKSKSMDKTQQIASVLRGAGYISLN